MTENNSWQPPSSAPEPSASPYGAPSTGQFAPPSAATPLPDARYSGAPAGGQAWTPPPKPGLIPLRPLSFGTLLGASFQVMRRNPKPTFGIALLLNGLVAVLFGAFYGFLAVFSFNRFESATFDEQNDILAGLVGGVLLATMIPLALSIIITALLQGLVSLEVARGTLGERLTVGGLWRLAKGRLGALIGWSFILSGVLFGVILALTLVVVLIGVLGGAIGVGIGILVGVLGGLVFVAVSVWVGTKVSLVPSLLMLERETIIGAVRRSWSLTNGYFWKTFGTQLLVNVIVQTAAQIITTPVSFIIGLGGGLINPNEAESGVVALLVVTTVFSGVVGTVFGAIAVVIQSAVIALIYIDIRMRKEGLDLELTRFVEARQSGDTNVANPYSRQAEPSTGAIHFASSASAAPNTSPWA
ncbi:MAG: hypothetical protein ACOH1J_07070 [Microbacteriaceae bacterium]